MQVAGTHHRIRQTIASRTHPTSLRSGMGGCAPEAASKERLCREKKFTSDEVPLAQILEQARTGVLQLPDFQRGWVWDDNHIASLLASISVSYPIGAVMTLQAGNPDVRFRPRALEGVELKKPTEPEFMLLDGQQ